METLLKDVRFGLRTLLKKPGFTAVAVLTLALGVGANTAIFSVVNGILLRPLPYRDPERVVTLWQRNDKINVRRDDVAPANFLDWKARSRSFERLSAAEPYGFDYTGDGDPENLMAWLVFSDFFETLGVGALHGRTFRPEEFEKGNDQVVVISHRFWQRRFGGDPQAVGRTILLDGRTFEIVGVMPAEMKYPEAKDLWVPRYVYGEGDQSDDRKDRLGARLAVVGRLKDGVTVEQAAAEMDAIAARLAQEHPQTNGETGVTTVALPEQVVGRVRTALLVLLGAVGLVLLIACANVANLLLVRGAERQRELAIRSALGAARARLARQMFTESLLLALLGGAGGVVLAVWGVDAILAISPEDLPRIDDVRIDARVLSFALGVSLLTSLVFGLAPALQFSRPDLGEMLKEGGRGASAGRARHRLRNVLIVSEVALALMLLIGAGLLVRSFSQLLKVDPGFRTDKTLAMQIFFWDYNQTPESRADFMSQVLERISGMPGVEAAGAVSTAPLVKMEIDTTFTVEGRPAPPPGQELAAYRSTATENYFGVLGIPLRAGRLFDSTDRKDSTPVVIINETMARRYWADENPVGLRIFLRSTSKPVSREIVGVVGDVRHTGLEGEPRPELFQPYAQNPTGGMTLVVRAGAGDAMALAPAVKREIWQVNKNQTFYKVAAMESLLSDSLKARRFSLLLLGSFAAIALVIAGVGIYGLISFTTRQRTHEIGIRMALGAQSRDIIRMIVGEGVLLAALGVGAGLLGALALTRFLKSLLFGITPTDPLTYAALSALLFAVALAASYLPARRALKVDPVNALRYE